MLYIIYLAVSKQLTITLKKFNVMDSLATWTGIMRIQLH